MNRRAMVQRTTKETSVQVQIDLDESTSGRSQTGLPFLDHMLDALQSTAGLHFELAAQGDMHVDDHHLTEDCALVLGSAVSEALGERVGIARTASAYGILDEALIFAAIDLSGRAFSDVRLSFKREAIGGLSTENITHFFQSLALRLGAAIHLRTISAINDHHQAEAAFKAVGAALGQSVKLTGRIGVPSTKGSLV
jgi:imidazoleglycerol phosphate dehydratase HisB